MNLGDFFALAFIVAGVTLLAEYVSIFVALVAFAATITAHVLAINRHATNELQELRRQIDHLRI